MEVQKGIIMKKKQGFLALILLIGSLLRIQAASADIVVLMDTSGTILPWFDQINSRVLVDITEKFVRPGDTFHLVSFNSRVNLEIVQPVKTESDISKIVSRFMLLYPLGQNSDFISGLHFTWQYLSTLNQSTEKIVIIISDGIFNPPKNSDFQALTTEQVESEINMMTAKIRGAGWQVYYVKLPFPDDAIVTNLDGTTQIHPVPGSKQNKEQHSRAIQDNIGNSDSDGSEKAVVTSKAGETGGSPDATKSTSTGTVYQDISSTFTDALAITPSILPEEGAELTFTDSAFGMPEVFFPDNLGKRGRQFALPLKITNPSSQNLNLELVNIYLNGADVLEEKNFIRINPGKTATLKAQIKIPATVELGLHDFLFTLRFAGNTRVLPQEGLVSVQLVPFSFTTVVKNGRTFSYAVFIIILTVLSAFLIAFFILKRTSKPSHVLRRANYGETDERRETKEFAVSTGTGDTLSAQKIEQITPKPYSSERIASSRLSTEQQQLDRTNSNALTQMPESRKKIFQFETAKPYDSSALDEFSDGAASKQQAGETLAASIQKKPDQSTVSALARLQEEEKRNRLAILNASKPAYHKAETVRKGADPSQQIEIKSNKRIMLEIVVDRQNPHIGKRNIHVLKPGSRFSIGGNNSSFLVFLVRFPSRIAELRYDGEKCDLAIIKPEYFPLEANNIIPDCVGRTFKIVSDRGYEVSFRFAEYEDPVIKLNEMLRSISI